jgi:hypothetical protein
MSEARILRYRATWDTASHRGLIEILPEGEGAKTKSFALTNAAEFAALSTLLLLDGEVYLKDETLITTRVQPPGLQLGS